jgi:hypothetical protein
MESNNEIPTTRVLIISRVDPRGQRVVPEMARLKAEYHLEERITNNKYRRPTKKKAHKRLGNEEARWDQLEAELCEYNQLHQSGADYQRKQSGFEDNSEGTDSGQPTGGRAADNQIEGDLPSESSFHGPGGMRRNYRLDHSPRNPSSSTTLADSSFRATEPLPSEDGPDSLHSPLPYLQLSPESVDVDMVESLPAQEHLNAGSGSARNGEAVSNWCQHQDEPISRSSDSDSFGDASEDEVDKLARSRRSRNPSRDLSDSAGSSENQTTATVGSRDGSDCCDTPTIPTIAGKPADIAMAAVEFSRDSKNGLLPITSTSGWDITQLVPRRSKRQRRTSAMSIDECQEIDWPAFAPPRKRRRCQNDTEY